MSEEETVLLIQMKFEGKTILWGDGIHDDSDAIYRWDTNKGGVYTLIGTELVGTHTLPANSVFYVPNYLDEDKIEELNNDEDWLIQHAPGCKFIKTPLMLEP